MFPYFFATGEPTRLVSCLHSLEKGDLIFRNSPDPEELFNPYHVAISVDGKYMVIGAENEYFKTNNKKIVIKKVEFTDLRDYSWKKFKVERSTSILNSSPPFSALPKDKQNEIRETIVDFAIKQHGKPFNHPLEDGFDNNPDTWYCSELTKASYDYALMNYPDVAKEIKLSLTPWEQFEWSPVVSSEIVKQSIITIEEIPEYRIVPGTKFISDIFINEVRVKQKSFTSGADENELEGFYTEYFTKMGWKRGNNIYPELVKETFGRIKNFYSGNKHAEIILNKQKNGTGTIIKLGETGSISKRRVRKKPKNIPVYPGSKIELRISEPSLFGVRKTVYYKTGALPKVVIR